MESTEEVWRDIKGFEHQYQVSNLGNVRSLDREIFFTTKYGTIASMIKKGEPIKVSTKIVLPGKDARYVDRVIIEAFNDIDLTEWDEVIHIDGDVHNNALSNLSWRYALLTDREWRDMKGAEGLYKVSEYGDVVRCPRTMITSTGTKVYLNCITLKSHSDEDGYLRIAITLPDGRHTEKGAHQYVAEAFIPNPEKKPTVNHKDGIKENNHVSNLEWATHQEQSDHAVATGLRTEKTYSDRSKVKEKLSQAVLCETNGQVYCSMIEAERQLHLYWGAVCDSIKRNKPIHGLTFRKLTSDRRTHLPNGIN